MCGVCGIVWHSDNRVAVQNCFLGLHAMQHRGQDAAGMAVWTGQADNIVCVKRSGLAREIFREEVLGELVGDIAIGHTRYRTAGPADAINAQPHLVTDKRGKPLLALCSNGDIVPSCYRRLRASLETGGTKFVSQNDGELLARLVADHLKESGADKKQIIGALQKVMAEVVGSYSALFIYDGKLIAFRDPLGIRPLVLARKNRSYVLASETVAFDAMDIDYEREILPGEVVIFEENAKEPMSVRLVENKRGAQCVFELIYFARPDSIVFGISVEQFRKLLGQFLSKGTVTRSEKVISVPDSSNCAALGYAQSLRIEFDFGLIRSHYTGRTFIMPKQEIRDDEIKMKLSPSRSVLSGKAIVVIDDSIVRGTTSRQIVQMLKDAGARQIHFRVASPSIKFSCFYGIDTPKRDELIAAKMNLEEIRDFIGADSLEYLRLEDLKEAIVQTGKSPDDFCFACFDGNYPTPVE